MALPTKLLEQCEWVYDALKQCHCNKTKTYFSHQKPDTALSWDNKDEVDVFQAIKPVFGSSYPFGEDRPHNVVFGRDSKWSLSYGSIYIKVLTSFEVPTCLMTVFDKSFAMAIFFLRCEKWVRLQNVEIWAQIGTHVRLCPTSCSHVRDERRRLNRHK